MYPTDSQSTPSLWLQWASLTVTVLTLFTSPSLASEPQSSVDDFFDLPPVKILPRVSYLPPPIPDPLEPVNRALWSFNRFALDHVVQPTAKGYRFVVRKPVRTSIRHFHRNLHSPGRIFNHMLQGRWNGAGQESARFAVNTTAGIAGFFDVATRWDMPKSEAKFGQTFDSWGWDPNFFIMIPLLGPSNDRDAVGLAADTLANPLLYFSPYSYANGGMSYNELSESVDSLTRFIRSEKDAYSKLAYAWTFLPNANPVDLSLPPDANIDPAALQTLLSVFIAPKDPEFAEKAKTIRVTRLPSKKRFPASLWAQSTPAPLVYLLPGLGADRLSASTVAIAEHLHNNGYSVVSLSNPYHFEFIERAATTTVPGFIPVDVADLHDTLHAIDTHLDDRFPNQFMSRAVVGYSMGGFLALMLANPESETETATTKPRVKFDRHVAISTPTRLQHGIRVLDAFFEAPMEWPESERIARVEATLQKVARMATDPAALQGPPPFDAIESRFLIGLVFRLVLRDTIYASQEQDDLGILSQPIRHWRRAALYEEILAISFEEYFNRFVIPHHIERLEDLDLQLPSRVPGSSGPRLDTIGSLAASKDLLSNNPNIRLIQNRNDILLTREDVQWLESTFSPEQLRVFDQGGHLGNLQEPEVQAALLDALNGL